MSRRRAAVRRVIAPDPKFESAELSSFINRVMKGGKKSVAQRAVYQALDKKPLPSGFQGDIRKNG